MANNALTLSQWLHEKASKLEVLRQLTVRELFFLLTKVGKEGEELTDKRIRILGDLDNERVYDQNVFFVSLECIVDEESMTARWSPRINDYVSHLFTREGENVWHEMLPWLREFGIFEFEYKLPEPVVTLPAPPWMKGGVAKTMFESEAAQEASAFQGELQLYTMVLRPKIWHMFALGMSVYAVGIGSVLIDLYFDQPIMKFLTWVFGG